jgi:hypothetical protein
MARLRKGHAEGEVLPLEPAGADAEVSPATGEDVERGHRLHQDAGMVVGDAGHHRAEADAAGDGGGRGQRAVALQHGVLGGADLRDLEIVIHHPE